MRIFYFDTSIWLDLFENRDLPNLPKSEWATKLLNKIVLTSSKIIVSDHVINEITLLDRYSVYDVENMFKPLKPIFIFAESTEKQVRRAKDLASKRKVPRKDALHALIARDHKAILVTLDNHFKELEDITKPHNPKNLI